MQPLDRIVVRTLRHWFGHDLIDLLFPGCVLIRSFAAIGRYEDKPATHGVRHLLKARF
jgi:hypothetical protein